MRTQSHLLHIDHRHAAAHRADGVDGALVRRSHLDIDLVGKRKVIDIKELHAQLHPLHAPGVLQVTLGDRKARVQPALLDEVAQLREVQGIQFRSFTSHVCLRPSGQTFEERKVATFPGARLLALLSFGSPVKTFVTGHPLSQTFALLSLPEVPQVVAPDGKEGRGGVSKPQTHRMRPKRLRICAAWNAAIRLNCYLVRETSSLQGTPGGVSPWRRGHHLNSWEERRKTI